jgi:protein-S-isoprenylcysteine O-methyltransferase Ste14
MIARFLPLIGTAIFAAIAFCWRPWLHSRRYGTSGILLFRSGNRRQNVRDSLAVLLFVLLLGQASVEAAWPQSLSPLAVDRRGLWRAGGAALLLGGLVLLVMAQLHLGASWRIGIEEGRRAGLITGGLYRFCRNPIYLAMLMVLAGYALLLPTRLSLALLLGGYVGIRQQVSAEEAYLLRTYGDAFRDYAGRVGRFLPGIGRIGRRLGVGMLTGSDMAGA